MMKLFTTLALILAAAAANANVCFNDKKSYESAKKVLPPLLQQVPVILVTESWIVTGGLKVDFNAENRIQAQSTLYVMGKYSNDTGTVKNVCLENDGSVSIVAKEPLSLAIDGNDVTVTSSQGSADFTKSDANGLNRVIAKVNKKRNRDNW